MNNLCDGLKRLKKRYYREADTVFCIVEKCLFLCIGDMIRF